MIRELWFYPSIRHYLLQYCQVMWSCPCLKIHLKFGRQSSLQCFIRRVSFAFKIVFGFVVLPELLKDRFHVVRFFARPYSFLSSTFPPDLQASSWSSSGYPFISWRLFLVYLPLYVQLFPRRSINTSTSTVVANTSLSDQASSWFLCSGLVLHPQVMSWRSGYFAV